MPTKNSAKTLQKPSKTQQKPKNPKIKTLKSGVLPTLPMSGLNAMVVNLGHEACFPDNFDSSKPFYCRHCDENERD